VFVEGNVIDLGTYKLQVAEACDGLRYLFPLMTIGFIMAYFYRAAMWKRVAVVLSSIPLTILMNSIRIGVIGVMVEYWGIGMAEGFLHEFQGWLVFMITAALMLGEIAALSAVGSQRAAWRDLFSIELPPPTPPGALIQRRSLPVPLFVAAAVLTAQLAASSLLPQRPEIIPMRASLSEFPSAVLGRNAHPVAMEQVYQDALKLDDYLLADYVDAAGSPVNLYIAYYSSQRKGESVHSPRSCLPGGGWQMRDFGQRDISGVRYNGQPLRVNRAIIELGDQRSLVYYWFVQRGRIVTNEFAVKWYLFWDALTRQRTDGALVRLVEPLSRGESEAQADRDLAAFAGAISQPMPEFVRN
jgi:exosortase D (VPLPA-CTERM-specific)